MADHATRILQPSGFKRTLNCPGWGNLCTKLDIKPKPSSKYAAEGSVAHHLGEMCLSKDQDAAQYIGQTGWYNNGRCGVGSSDIAVQEAKGKHFIFTVDDGMAEAVQVYLDEVRRKREATVGGTFLIEERLDLGWLVPGMYGTGDHTIVEPLSRVYVDDYKHGAGVAVEVGEKVGDNPQLSIYALGAIGDGNPHMVEEVVVTIVQPRAIHPDGPVRSIKFDVEDLLSWGSKVLLPAAQAAQKPGAPIKAGDWCKWCDAEDQCPALRKKALQAADVMFDDALVPVKTSAPPEPELLDKQQMSRILAFTEMFESWLKAVKEEAYRRLETGADNAPDTMKLVAGRLSNRAWKTPDKTLLVAFGSVLPRADILAPEKVKSPAQIEKAMKAAGLKPAEINTTLNAFLKERKPGSPLMVPVTDIRPALPPAVERMFKE